MGTSTSDEKGKKRVQRFHKRPVVPPPDSPVWPEEYRGERWKPIYAFFFAGKCQLCAYSFAQPDSLQFRDRWHHESRRLFCVNRPDDPGALREVLPTETCRNFKKKYWWPPKHKRTGDPNPPHDQSDPTIRRISLGNGLFTIVDAADYEWLSKYKWYARRCGGHTYAFCHTGRKQIFMHRMIMRPRKGRMVDHIDHNGLNNRRCNLRFCTAEQNAANARSHGGLSGFVGLRCRGGKYQAGITYKGKYYCLGTFTDPVEAAKARDRKAYEFWGAYAYLNFPEDFPPVRTHATTKNTKSTKDKENRRNARKP